MLTVRVPNGGIRTAPFNRLGTLGRELDEWFDDVLPQGWFNRHQPRLAEARAWVPPMDLREQADAYLCMIEVPGLRPDDIELTVEGDVLTISGEKRYEHDDDGTGYRFAERRYGRFVRSLRLPGHVDANNVSARYDHGVLTVTLPKVEEARPRRIQVVAAAPERQITGAAE